MGQTYTEQKHEDIAAQVKMCIVCTKTRVGRYKQVLVLTNQSKYNLETPK